MHRYHVKRERRHRHSDHPRGVDRCSGCRVQNLSLPDGPSFLAILEIELFTQNDDADRVFFIESGRVIIRYLTDDFRLITSKIAHAGDVLGLANAWHNAGPSS
jgi:CRP-like cAMP-binding protein